MRLVSIVEYPKKKRTMKVFSNQPGIQFYTGNFLPRDGMLGKVDIDNRYANILTDKPVCTESFIKTALYCTFRPVVSK